MSLDQVLYMQVEISNLYMNRKNISPKEFLELDRKYNILEYIKEAYEPFHLMGSEGILDEINDYIDTQSNIK